MSRTVALAVVFVILVPVVAFADDLAITYPPERVKFARTDDGWDLAIVHFAPADYGATPRPGALPLFLCHGLTSTSITFHFGGDVGLAPYLARQGYDVWAVNLRGEREGSRPKRGTSRTPGWTFQDHLDRDIPALLDAVLRETGAPKVIWVGHSMGGILLYTTLIRHGDSKIAAGVTLGSPIVFGHHDDFAKRLLIWNRLVRGSKTLRAEDGAKLLAHMDLDGPLADRFTRWVANPENFPPAIRRVYLYNSVPNLSETLLTQFSDSLANDTLMDPKSGADYRARMGEIKVPMIVLGGSMDYLAPPYATLAAYERLGSADKTYRVFSRANGYAFDYGHGDLCAGVAAAREVYPVVGEWIARHELAPCDDTACSLKAVP
jgi:pimeloyl-ACP methyl ester carboxylesterase